MDTRKEKIKQKAQEIHKCPVGYIGPCWGPNHHDYKLAAELVDKEEESNGY